MRNTTENMSLMRRLIRLLGSMDFAITLLLVLAVASVIGTVLQQNQPYADYLIKFGPFWFELFEAAGLYDVYSALWFLIILVLLVISTSTCVIRHTPSMLKEMWHIRTKVSDKSLRLMAHNAQWQSGLTQEKALTNTTTELQAQGFRVKQVDKGDHIVLAAMKGSLNRLGYLFTHIAIVVICIGGLLDSHLPIKFAQWQGDVVVETRNLASDEVPNESRIPAGAQAFRGSIQIAEGRAANVVFLPLKEGYLVQELPFVLKVEDFRIEHYATGQPKSFETDLVLFDDELAEPIRQTIAVTHPLHHKGYAIYQSSFADGGTHLTIQAWPIDEKVGHAPASIKGRVFDKLPQPWGETGLQLELTDFRPFNINPDPTEDNPDNMTNFGPSFGFKLRSATGEAREYVNYMAPIVRDGRAFFLSGVRNTTAEGFQYLFIPADRQGTITAFTQYLQRIRNATLVKKVASEMAAETLKNMSPQSDQKVKTSLEGTLQQLIELFISGGFVGVNQFIATNLPEAQREQLGAAYLSMLREMLARLYFADRQTIPEVTEADLMFLQDAADAIGSLSRYGSPVYLALKDYQHIQASGLQISRSPGKTIVYIGCALLIIGVFILFYLPQIRCWVKVGRDEKILLAGMSNRNPHDFDLFFSQLMATLKFKTDNRDVSDE